MVPMIIEDFGTRATWPCRAHLPEIVRCCDPNDTVLWNANFLPDFSSFVIGMIDCDKQFVFINAELSGHEVPSIRDRLGLEVITKAEVSEHFEKGMVARCVANIIKVVVLATGADAFLAGCCARVVPVLETGEDILELHHA